MVKLLHHVSCVARDFKVLAGRTFLRQPFKLTSCRVFVQFAEFLLESPSFSLLSPRVAEFLSALSSSRRVSLCSLLESPSSLCSLLESPSSLCSLLESPSSLCSLLESRKSEKTTVSGRQVKSLSSFLESPEGPSVF